MKLKTTGLISKYDFELRHDWFIEVILALELSFILYSENKANYMLDFRKYELYFLKFFLFLYENYIFLAWFILFFLVYNVTPPSSIFYITYYSSPLSFIIIFNLDFFLNPPFQTRFPLGYWKIFTCKIL